MKKTRIIIVEDNNIISLDLMYTLEKMGYEIVTIIEEGEEAVKQILKLQPDLVIMDIKLRDKVDGIEVAERIQVTSKIPILFVSAYADQDTIQRATKSSNKINYIVKPFENSELYNSIDIILNENKN